MNAKVFALAALVAASLTGCASTSESETDAAAAAAASTSGPDAAASASMSPAHPVDPGQPFSDMDTNKDGMLSKDELAGNEMLTQHFVQADTDGNGSLSQAEVDSHRAAMAGKPD